MTLKFAFLSLIALALTGATGAMSATSCPRGQVFRVSKQICVDRNEAVKLGILRGAAAAAPQADVQPTPDAAPEEPQAPEPTPAPKPHKALRAPKSAHAPPAALAEPAPSDQDLTATSAPRAADPARSAASAEKPASPFGVLDTGNVPAPLR